MTKQKHRYRYHFFLSPFERMAFTRCPKCEGKTRQRKLPLLIHIEPSTMSVLNKTCRYCPYCDLLIARKSQIEPLLKQISHDVRPRVERGEYLVIGTVDRKDWQAGMRGDMAPADALDRAWFFKDVWEFERTGGWGPADAAP